MSAQKRSAPSSQQTLRDHNGTKIQGNAAKLRAEQRDKRQRLSRLEDHYANRTTELKNPDSDTLHEYTTKLDLLNKEKREFTGTTEDEADTRQFNKVTESVSYQARMMQGSAIDLTKFLKQLSETFGATAQDGAKTFSWLALGRETAGLWRRVPRCTMLPSDFIDKDAAPKPQKAPQQRRKMNTTIGEVEKTIGSEKLDESASTTTQQYKHYITIIKKIRKIQQHNVVTAIDGKERYGVPLVPTLFDPQSFSRTIEHLFYLSFSVKQNMASIFLSKDKELCVGVSPDKNSKDASKRPGGHDNNADEDDTPTNQFVFSLDLPMFRELISIYDLEGQRAKIRM